MTSVDADIELQDLMAAFEECDMTGTMEVLSWDHVEREGVHRLTMYVDWKRLAYDMLGEEIDEVGEEPEHVAKTELEGNDVFDADKAVALLENGTCESSQPCWWRFKGEYKGHRVEIAIA